MVQFEDAEDAGPAMLGCKTSINLELVNEKENHYCDLTKKPNLANNQDLRTLGQLTMSRKSRFTAHFLGTNFMATTITLL